MEAIVIVAVLVLLAALAWSCVCIRRVARGHWIRHPEQSLWFPAVFGIVTLLGVLSVMQERDEAARLAMEREVVRINDCPRPAPGLSSTVALLVNAPAGVQPRTEHCFRLRDRAQKIAEAQR